MSLGIQRTTSVQTANYAAGRDEAVLADATAGSFTVTLPSAASAFGAGRVVVVRLMATAVTNRVTVQRFGTDTIDSGTAPVVLAAAGDRVEFTSDGNGGWTTADSQVRTSVAAAKTVAPGATLALKAALTRAKRSTSIGLIGDSTGDSLDQSSNPNDEWFTVLGAQIGAAYPAWSVWHQRWSVANETYSMPTSIQAGTGGGGGDRYATIAGGTLQYTSTFGPAGDHEVFAKIQPTSWVPGGGAALRTIVCRYSSTSGSNRGWYFALNETGNLVWVWSSTGSADVATIVSTAPVGFVDGTPGWVRVTFDVDNGASGNDVKFYTSPDGTTWTQLGTTVTTAGATTISATFLNYYLGSHSTTPVSKFTGRIYWVDVRSALTNGNSQVPTMPDWWDMATSPGTGVTYGGAPVLLLLNGSATGQNIAYFNDSTRRGKLSSPRSHSLLFLSNGHNEGTYTQGIYKTLLAAWLTDIRTRYTCPVIVGTQNPSIVGSARADQETADYATVRGPVTLAMAATYAGVHGLDVWPQFTDTANQLISDGLHPSTAGSLVWATYVYNQLFG